MTPVVSSQIHSIGYDPATKTLAVIFHAIQPKGAAKTDNPSRPLYHYSGFSAQQFQEFLKAPSKYSHFYHKIRGKHSFTKIP